MTDVHAIYKYKHESKDKSIYVTDVHNIYTNTRTNLDSNRFTDRYTNRTEGKKEKCNQEVDLKDV